MPWQDSNTNGGKICHKHSATPGETISGAGLVPGELAVNSADGKIYYRKSNGQSGAIPTGLTGNITIEDINSTLHTFTFVDGILTNYEPL